MSLQRIEHALARLEAATRQLSADRARLQASNAKLREAVTTSLTQLDGLITRQGGRPRA